MPEQSKLFKQPSLRRGLEDEEAVALSADHQQDELGRGLGRSLTRPFRMEEVIVGKKILIRQGKTVDPTERR